MKPFHSGIGGVSCGLHFILLGQVFILFSGSSPFRLSAGETSYRSPTKWMQSHLSLVAKELPQVLSLQFMEGAAPKMLVTLNERLGIYYHYNQGRISQWVFWARAQGPVHRGGPPCRSFKKNNIYIYLFILQFQQNYVIYWLTNKVTTRQYFSTTVCCLDCPAALYLNIMNVTISLRHDDILKLYPQIFLPHCCQSVISH